MHSNMWLKKRNKESIGSKPQYTNKYHATIQLHKFILSSRAQIVKYYKYQVSEVYDSDQKALSLMWDFLWIQAKNKTVVRCCHKKTFDKQSSMREKFVKVVGISGIMRVYYKIMCECR